MASASTSTSTSTTTSTEFVSCRVVSCRVASCRVVSRRVASCRVVSRRFLSCRVPTQERQTSKGTNASKNQTKIKVCPRTFSRTKVRNFGQVEDKSSQLQKNNQLNNFLTYRLRNISVVPPYPPISMLGRRLILLFAELRTFVLKNVRCENIQPAIHGHATLKSGGEGGAKGASTEVVM